MCEAFAGTEQFTVIGRKLQAGDPAPDFRLDYIDLADLATMQRPYKPFSGPRRNEGPEEVTPDRPGEGAAHQLEHKEQERER
jgi:hypothetical protein